ncbi:type IV toxin-antitoxin system AbiEi family antitoxin domain-containing protein [uncultured Nocardioides sp.]|uniref:type IV toxin-antitoxin system AbiEi family antitoxin domain-containing protein n=1 Tax=uncultured Nocardioides sp. TaxID=198441 RepID=UPI00261761A0|nr:type IV toxin-antitoxin system AbiEi family antitoxin domain-containing protein [uncultured Nocardioides sp.]
MPTHPSWTETSLLGSDFPLPLDQPFTLAQSRAEGVRPPVLRRLCESGLLRRPVRGVYLATQAGDSPLLRAQSLGLVMPPDAVVCDRHAGYLHGTDMTLAPNEHLHLSPVSVARPSDHGRVKGALAVGGERALASYDVTEVMGLPVTTRLRTALDLGRVRNPDRAIAGMDAMLRLGGFTQDELVASTARFAGARWVTTLREIAPLTDARAESPPESVLRLRCLQAGIEGMVPQVEVYDDGRLLARLDLADEELRFAAEYDGVAFHSSSQQVSDDRTRRSALEEKQDWTIVVVVNHHLVGPHQDAELLLRQGVREARRRAGRRVHLDW